MSKRQYLITTTNLVKTLLAIDPQTRNSDSYLYLKVLEHYSLQKGIDLKSLTVEDFLLSMNSLGFPCSETVRRTRQKIQREHPEFKACKSVEEARMENEQVFREYSKSAV